ncbi:tRNA glutamyl-Q(34) synthetase GluQRS [Thiolapillus brandeum]|nr:tRNA glutamyl-Q(34) synthetase GluQRS [Thiolapillus brandeum]
MAYRGRFAPSPSGPLHAGSLVAAVASYADALAHRGQWLVRMEDVDEGRSIPGAADAILKTLECHGFQWHGDVLFQSTRKDRYREVINTLINDDQAYRCACTRKQIQAAGHEGIEGIIYPGTCRQGLPSGQSGKAVRLRTDDRKICFQDRICGTHCQVLSKDIGDFIIQRADGYTAYQLAVVIDDADQGINQVVRGKDLLLSTPRQIRLQEHLGFPRPEYAHVPLLLDEQGRKLSKQDKARPLLDRNPLPALLSAWQYLGQVPPPEAPANQAAFWNWAKTHWDIARVPME